MDFSKILIYWYLKNKRDLPWRHTNDPYHIWLSEIMLQQTRIEQGLPYYLRFITTFPRVFDLAEASLEQVLKLWQGLGYYSRARNLHETARSIAGDLNGVFPDSYKKLLGLKGVGDYTASAIASICYQEPVAVVDGNVYRVLARYFGIDTPVNTSAGIREFKALAQQLLDASQPGTFNQSVMEFGALLCKPQLPLCESCPLSGGCYALQYGRVKELPVKLKKAKVRTRYFNYLVFRSDESRTLLEKRSGRGIWEGLYQFPLVESQTPLTSSELLLEERFLQLAGSAPYEISLYNESPVVHKLSHQHLVTSFWIIEREGFLHHGIPVELLPTYPVPVLIANFLNEFEFSNY